MRPVLCSGNLVVDVLVRPVEQIQWGATTLVDAIEQHIGGNGANTSFTLARLGVPVHLLGVVGRDAFGDLLLAELGRAGVDVSGISRSAAPTAASVALVRSSGDRCFLHRLGSSAEFSPDEGAFSPESLARFSH